MSQDKSDYEKKLAQANAARLRQIERQKEKLACPLQQQKIQDKQKTSQMRAYAKMKERLADPVYINEQREKKIKASEKQLARLQVKESDPEYISNKITNKIAQAKALQANVAKKSIVQSTSNLSAKKKNDAIVLKSTKTIKSKRLSGRNPTAIEKLFGNKIGDIGCICCLNKKWYTTDMQEQEVTKFVSLHHVDGRTKEWAHAKVLPLCAYHHDIPAPSHAPVELTPIHRGNKKEWVEFNGTEEALLKQVYEIIEEDRPWLVSEE